MPSSKTKTVTMIENCDEEIIDLLLLNWNELVDQETRDGWQGQLTTPYNTLLAYRKLANGGEVRVTYEQKNGIGRFWAKGQASQQGMSRKIRNTIAGRFYYDIDIVNSSATCLEQYCGKKGIPCPRLAALNSNREGLLQELQELTKLSRRGVKTEVIKTLFGGHSFRGQPTPQWWGEFVAELTTIREVVFNTEPVYAELGVAKAVEKMKEGKHADPKASCLCQLLFDIENTLTMSNLECLMEMGVVDKKKPRGVLVFDGIQVLRELVEESNLDTGDILSQVETYTKEKTGYTIQLKVKSMTDEVIKLPDLMEEQRNPQSKYFKGKTYEKVKATFEETHFKCMHPCGYGDETGKDFGDDLIIRSQKKMEDFFANLYYYEYSFKDAMWKPSGFIPRWTCDEAMRTVRKIAFIPAPLECPANVFNLYDGLRAESLPEAQDNQGLGLVLEHVRRLVGGSENANRYMLNWLALRVQKPAELPRVAIIMRSDQGSGKNLFWDFFGKQVLGKKYYYCTEDVQKVVGRFAVGLKNKLIVVMDEASGKDTFTYSETIKALITSEDIQYEQKGVDSITLSNHAGFVLPSNKTVCAKLEYSDRRFVLFDSLNDKLNDVTYFEPLIKAVKSDAVAKSFYNHLMEIDISTFDPINDRPVTPAYRQLQEVSIPIEAKFLNDYISELSPDQTEVKERATDLFKEFNVWCANNNVKSDKNSTSFGIHLGKWGVTRVKSSGVRKYLIDVEAVLATFKQKGIFQDDLSF